MGMYSPLIEGFRDLQATLREEGRDRREHERSIRSMQMEQERTAFSMKMQLQQEELKARGREMSQAALEKYAVMDPVGNRHTVIANNEKELPKLIEQRRLMAMDRARFPKEYAVINQNIVDLQSQTEKYKKELQNPDKLIEEYRILSADQARAAAEIALVNPEAAKGIEALSQKNKAMADEMEAEILNAKKLKLTERGVAVQEAQQKETAEYHREDIKYKKGRDEEANKTKIAVAMINADNQYRIAAWKGATSKQKDYLKNALANISERIQVPRDMTGKIIDADAKAMLDLVHSEVIKDFESATKARIPQEKTVTERGEASKVTVYIKNARYNPEQIKAEAPAYARANEVFNKIKTTHDYFVKVFRDIQEGRDDFAGMDKDEREIELKKFQDLAAKHLKYVPKKLFSEQFITK